jgi:hypothetical protein
MTSASPSRQKGRPVREPPSPRASLSESEVLTLAVFARWSRFNSERDFYRYADTTLREAGSLPYPA